MMQAYSPSFARIYNRRWAAFAQQAAPRILSYYETTPVGQQNRDLFDLCCGAGHLAQYFLDQGYFVTGLDLSAAMLAYARDRSAPYIVAGQARFIQGDAANFQLDQQFGLVVSTFDALNHLPDFYALKGCFLSVYPVLLPGGQFIFDLNTRRGLRRWTSVSVEDTEEFTLITRSLFDEELGRGYMHVSGFIPTEDGLYERFEETAYNTAFDLGAVKDALQQTGFQSIRFARSTDFSNPVEDPEAENRIFVIAEK
jgi:SAM-dependent methyltransferase